MLTTFNFRLHPCMWFVTKPNHPYGNSMSSTTLLCLTLRASSYFFNRGSILGGGPRGPPLKISGLTSAMTLKFWPVVDMDKWRWFAKFQFGHLFGWYFTDQNVNLAKMTYWLIGLVNLAEICSWSLICRTKVISGEKKLVPWVYGTLQTGL